MSTISTRADICPWLRLGPGDGAAPAEAQPALQITVEVTVIGLSDEQEARFGGNIEWLNIETGDFFTEANPAGVVPRTSKWRCTFIGAYNADETISSAILLRAQPDEEETPTPSTKKDKQHCGLLFLPSLRTGSRALGLEHGKSPKKYVPREWGVKPHLKISNLSRDTIGHVRGLGLIAAGPRSPQSGAINLSHDEGVPVAFRLETLRDLPNMEAFEDAGLL